MTNAVTELLARVARLKLMIYTGTISAEGIIATLNVVTFSTNDVLPRLSLPASLAIVDAYVMNEWTDVLF